MANRMPITQFVSELAKALNRGDGYIMGSYGQNPRTGYLDLSVTTCKSSWKTTGYYYTQYTGKQREQALKWREKSTRVWDCNGMAEGIYEIWSGVRIDSKARYNYAQWCSVKGTGIIPAAKRVPGAAVFWSDNKAENIHHVAYLWKPVTEGKPDGDWYLIEARGVMYGVVKSKLLSRKPNFWGYMDKYYDYSNTVTEVPPQVSNDAPTGIKYGDEGADVQDMQRKLMRLGYDLPKWGADGEFGSETLKALQDFQQDNGLAVTGVYDAATQAAVAKKLDARKWVEVTGGTVNVRTAPDTNSNILGVVQLHNRLPYQGETRQFNGRDWYMVEYANRNGWISSKYSKIVE